MSNDWSSPSQPFTGTTTYAVSGTMSSTVYNCSAFKLGDRAFVEVVISFTSAPNAAGLAVDIPTELPLNTAKFGVSPTNRRVVLGVANIYDGTGSRAYVGNVVYNTSARVTVHHSESGNTGQVSDTAPFTIDTATTIALKYDYPVT